MPESNLSPAITGDAQAIVDTTIAAAAPKLLDSQEQYSVVVPAGATHEIIDTERFALTPWRATGTHYPATVDSFVDLVKRHQDDAEDTITVWVHPLNGRIVAVLNDHGPGQDQRWGDHRVDLQLRHTPEWERWAGKDGSLMDQETFAELLQDGLTEIAEPPAADLLELAQTMRGTTSVAWKSGISVRDGSVQMGYTEDAQASAGRDGKLAIPETFTLVLAPFIGEPAIQVTARLRWRVQSGNLRLGYKLQQPDLIVRVCLEQVAQRLRAEFPGVVFTGTPRDPS